MDDKIIISGRPLKIEGDVVNGYSGEFEVSRADLETLLAKPSGRVSVPVAFIEAVRHIEKIWYAKENGEWTLGDCMKEQDRVFKKLRPMLDHIGKE